MTRHDRPHHPPGRRSPASPGQRQAARDHVTQLRQDGGTYRSIAAAAALSPATVRDLATGRRTSTPRHGHRRPHGDQPHPARARLDAGGTRLRLRALHVMGHGSARIARATGVATRPSASSSAATPAPSAPSCATPSPTSTTPGGTNAPPPAPAASAPRPPPPANAPSPATGAPPPPSTTTCSTHPATGPVGLETRHRHRHRPRHPPARRHGRRRHEATPKKANLAARPAAAGPPSTRSSIAASDWVKEHFPAAGANLSDSLRAGTTHRDPEPDLEAEP